ATLAMRTGAHAPVSDPIFIESAATTGLAFTHVNGASGRYYLPEVMGSGVALFDYDNDGDLDVFLVQGGPLVPGGATGAPTSRLFRNDLVIGADGGRRLHFTDVTDRARAGVRGYGMGAAVGDYDNDGYLDLFVTAFGPATLLHNNGDGTFTDVTSQAGVSDTQWSTSAAFVDYDRDGDLDLFVAHYVDFTLAGNKLCNDAAGARDYCSPRAFRPVPDRLFRNDGHGRFTDVTAAAGIDKAYGAGLGVASVDYDNDGWPDLFVANGAVNIVESERGQRVPYRMKNQLFHNAATGRFEETSAAAGPAFERAEIGRGAAFGDIDNDGDTDIVVTN